MGPITADLWLKTPISLEKYNNHLVSLLFATLATGFDKHLICYFIKYVSQTAKLLFIQALSDCWKNFYVAVTMGEISNNETNLCPANNQHDIRLAPSKLYFKHRTNGSLVNMTSER